MLDFDTIENALKSIQAGNMVVVVDDEDRENEGDLIMAAQCVTPADVNFMATHGRGLICVPLSDAYANRLQLNSMVEREPEDDRCHFTVSVDCKHGTSTGISASDRAKTIQAIVSPASVPEDFLRPGHIFPLKAKDGGVLARPGHTEAAVDLATLAGYASVGVICEICREDGEMMRGDELAEFAKRHELPLISIADLITYRRNIQHI